ncbi:putative conserved membrane protein [Synechococcus sp. A15-62]|nr:putative conserved membrane protein [Synechococcus sp. A15-62]
MQPRSEPLLWLQCLALGAIPLELLLIRLVLAGADPGPVPGVERVLIWGVGVLAPAVALWRRPADWGSLLLVRQPLASRSSDQLRISASHGALRSRLAVVMAAVILLPVLWWLDDSAVLASEFSPVSGQSRLATLLLVSPLLALMVWQVQQMVQAAALLLLGSTAPVASTDASFRADAVATQRTSLGLQLLNLPSLEWPEPAEKPSNQGADGAMSVEDSEPETDDSTEKDSTEDVNAADISSDNEEPDDETSALKLTTAEESDDTEETAPTSDQDADEAIGMEDSEPETDDSTEKDSTEDVNAADISSDNEEPDDETSALKLTTAEESDETEPEASIEPVEPPAQVEEPEDIGANVADESTFAASGSVPVEPEQSGEEQESTALDTEISQIDSVAGGSTEGHREQAEASGSEESEPDEPSEPTPGGL